MQILTPPAARAELLDAHNRQQMFIENFIGIAVPLRVRGLFAQGD